jgi:hypothetical protein
MARRRAVRERRDCGENRRLNAEPSVSPRSAVSASQRPRALVATRNLGRCARSAFLALALATAVLAATAGDDVARDFSASSNPAGPWTWGWMPSIAEGFKLATGNYPSAAHVDRWTGDGEATLYMNRTARVQTSGTGVFMPGQLTLHPGRHGQLAAVRWTAARTGIVRVEATFTRRDYAYPTTSTAWVLRQGREVFKAELNAHRSRAGFGSLVSVRAGATLDFAVGFGANGNWAGDSTGLAVRITWQDASGTSSAAANGAR